jgi:hypothetical protein
MNGWTWDHQIGLGMGVGLICLAGRGQWVAGGQGIFDNCTGGFLGFIL